MKPIVEFQIPSEREMIKSIPNARFQWQWKKPLGKWCYLYGIGRMATNWIRVPIFQEDPRTLYILSYLGILNANLYYALTLYTFYYYLSRGNLHSCLPCTCMLGLIFAGYPLLLQFVSVTRFKLASLINFGGRYIYRNEHDDVEYQQICSNQLDVTMRSFLIKMSMITLSFTVAVNGPIHAFLTNGTKTTTIELRIPFTGENSDAEFLLNLSNQFFIGTYGGLSYIALEVMMSLFGDVVKVSPALIKLEMKRICEEYGQKLISESQMRLRFKNVVVQSLDVDDYVSELSQLLYWRTLVTPIVFTYSIGMSIYCQYQMGFVAGYGMAMMTWVQLFYICELGENIQDNGFNGALYHVNWVILPIDIQKDIMHLINRKQNVAGIRLGPFGCGINRNVFKICTNKIYTLVMFLKNCFN